MLAGASAVGLAVLAMPGAALAVVNEPPVLPHSVLVFPERDFVSSSGFAATDSVVINVLRNGVTIGTSAPLTPIDDPGTPGFDGIAEVNHPGGGCWTTTTPDILPGDVVRATVAGAPDQDQTTTANVTVDRPTSPASGTIVVTGTAQTAAGDPIPVDQIEQRLVAPGASFDLNGRRTLRANSVGADGNLAYDAAGSIHFTATYTGLTAADVTLALGAESRSMWLGSNPGTGQESTIFENPGTPGPSAPCTAPLAVNGVTATDHLWAQVPTVNQSNVTTDLKLDGLAESDATAVSVQVGDSLGGSTSMVPATLTTGPNGITWTATIPAAQIGALADGTLKASATITTPGGDIGGSMLAIHKDTVGPADPTVAPGPGTYATSQAVLLSETDGTATVYYTLDGSAPNEITAVAGGQIMITSSATLRAIAIDPAGNTSAIKDFVYTITPPVVTPPAGGGGTPPAGGGGTPAGGGGTPAAGAGGTPAAGTGGTPAAGAGAAAGAGITAASGTTATAAKPRLVLRQLGVAPRIKQSKARKSGLRITMRVPAGTEVVRINVYRRTAKGLTLLSSGFKAPAAAGLYRVTQSHAALRRQLTKGSYEVQVAPGYGRTQLGSTSKATFKVV
ncbi:MAG TPA: chitobiase/beta-hexosaminidase C-terminal domain-containing protein [Solirubrobacteraceae bacterium]|nr:chitobiase/beta-hexosaminidase C-terminal domain-containing protein [Solirubrobacteraceae bacterium]